jgi:hypothetical protein
VRSVTTETALGSMSQTWLLKSPKFINRWRASSTRCKQTSSSDFCLCTSFIPVPVFTSFWKIYLIVEFISTRELCQKHNVPERFCVCQFRPTMLS